MMTSSTTAPVPDSTPVLVGAGQFADRLDLPGYLALSPYNLAAQACRRACADALSLETLRSEIDALASTRTFDASRPVPSPFGISSNHPRSIATRLGIRPRLAILEASGGDSPQRMVHEMCDRISRGEINMALVVGSEAISTARHLQAIGRTLDWSEEIDGSLDDRGGIRQPNEYNARHRMVGAPTIYALLENARRARLCLSREAYAQRMGELFAPFTQVAAHNPYAASPQQPRTAEELVRVGPRNRMIADPFCLRVVSRDQVNQGAALLLTSVGRARALGIRREKWVFLHGSSALTERPVLQRLDLGAAPGAQMAAQAALDRAGVSKDQIRFFDFYSCFPIAVFNAASDGLGLDPADSRGLTVTGGLPYFGGPGNSYSLHAIAEMTYRLRAHPGAFGFVGANGGHLDKYAAGVYSATPKAWAAHDEAPLQACINAQHAPPLAAHPEGAARIETYTVVHKNGLPDHAIVVGRLRANNERFLALSAEGDTATLQAMGDRCPLQSAIHVRQDGDMNRFHFERT